MSKMRGKQGFEEPPPQDLEKYLKQGHKSISRMKDGKTHLKFRPRRSISTRLIGIVIFIIISSSIFIAASFLNLNQSNNNLPSNNQTFTSTIPQTQTTQPIILYEDIRSVIIDLEVVINQMISTNHSLITSVMQNGSVNLSQTIPEVDLLDFIWYLSQFEMYSYWWELGKELITERAYIWNESTYLSETIPFQLKTLRSLLAYPRYDLSLGILERTSFDNTCISLWENLSHAFSEETQMIHRSVNDSVVVTADQIIFLDILASTINQQDLFNNSQVQNFASEMIDKILILTADGKGLRESFSANLSWLSPILKYEDHGKLILSLNRLKEILQSTSSIADLILRLSTFVETFRELDWSISSEFDDSTKTTNQEYFLTNQAIGVRVSVLLDKINVANFQIGTIRAKFEASDSSFYSSTIDQEFQYLLDQLYLILSFEEYLVLNEEISGSVAAATFLGLGSILMMLILVPIKRKIKKSSPND